MKKFLFLTTLSLSCLVGCSARYSVTPQKPLIQSVPVQPTDTTTTPIGAPSPDGVQKPVQDVNMDQAS